MHSVCSILERFDMHGGSTAVLLPPVYVVADGLLCVTEGNPHYDTYNWQWDILLVDASLFSAFTNAIQAAILLLN